MGPGWEETTCAHVSDAVAVGLRPEKPCSYAITSTEQIEKGGLKYVSSNRGGGRCYGPVRSGLS